MYSTSRITGILSLSAGLGLAAGCLETGSDAEWAPTGGGQGLSVFTGSSSNVSSNDRDDEGAGGLGDDLFGDDLGADGFSGTGGLGSFAGFGDLGSAGSSGGGAAGTTAPVNADEPCVEDVLPGEPTDDGQGDADGVIPCALLQ